MILGEQELINSRKPAKFYKQNLATNLKVFSNFETNNIE